MKMNRRMMVRSLLGAFGMTVADLKLPAAPVPEPEGSIPAVISQATAEKWDPMDLNAILKWFRAERIIVATDQEVTIEDLPPQLKLMSLQASGRAEMIDATSLSSPARFLSGPEEYLGEMEFLDEVTRFQITIRGELTSPETINVPAGRHLRAKFRGCGMEYRPLFY